MTPDDPRHGTYAGAMQHDGNLCPPCRRAATTYMRTWRHRKRASRCAMTQGHVPGTRTGLGWPLLSTAERDAIP